MRQNHSEKSSLRNRTRAPKSAQSPTLTHDQSLLLKIAVQKSELRYRRLFEASQDGILILDAGSGHITDVNPFLIKLLGNTRRNILGKKLWEIGLFQDMEKSRNAFRELQRKGYIRYENLPLETRDGRYIDVEFVSNVYQENGSKVIQCNIRDITERKHMEVEKAILETVEEEQRRIGQDLHDGLCQQLTGVALIAKALAQKLSEGGAASESADASEIADLISRSIDQTRDLARGLSPVEIEEQGLPTALQKLASSVERLYHISCEFKYDTHMQFDDPHRPLLTTHLYRIAQEAVNNATLHGKAKHIIITLIKARGQGMLRVQDDGLGLSPDFDEKPGLGLRSMRYRARIIRARLKLSEVADGGTVVTCSFPHENGRGSKKNGKN
jgi:PAS domain S-box-containing protein